jgi:hypothetical protein
VVKEGLAGLNSAPQHIKKAFSRLVSRPPLSTKTIQTSVLAILPDVDFRAGTKMWEAWNERIGGGTVRGHSSCRHASSEPSPPQNKPPVLKCILLTNQILHPLFASDTRTHSLQSDTHAYHERDAEDVAMLCLVRHLCTKSSERGSYFELLRVFDRPEIALALMHTYDTFTGLEQEEGAAPEGSSRAFRGTSGAALLTQANLALAQVEQINMQFGLDATQRRGPVSLLIPGDKVTLHGLVAKPELNGVHARVTGPGSTADRVSVRLIGPAAAGEVISIKRTCVDFEANPGRDLERTQLRIYEILEPTVREINSGAVADPQMLHPARELRKVLLEVLVRSAAARALEAYCQFKRGAVAKLSTDDKVFLSSRLTILARTVEHYARGPRRSADAQWIAAMAELLRGNCLESVQLFSNALAMSRWVVPAHRSIVEQVIMIARGGSSAPKPGRWRCMYGRPELVGLHTRPPPTAPPSSCGPSTVQAGSTLYCFGGLVHSQSAEFRPYLVALEMSAPATAQNGGEDIASDVLYALDLPTRKWRRVEPARGGLRPPPRAFAVLEHRDGCLWLFGGRRGWAADGPRTTLLRDLWKFDIASERWTEVVGKHPLLKEGGPSVMGSDSLFVVGFSSQGSATLHRYTIAANEWTTPSSKAQSTAPDIHSEAAGWGQDGRLFVWSAPGEDSKLRAPPSKLKTVNLYDVALTGKRWGTWTSHAMALTSESKNPSANDWGLAGIGIPASEAAAAFDPITKKAYIYGGWRLQYNEMQFSGVNGKPFVLSGRYYGTLVEVDVDAKRISAIEVTGSDREALGPGKRAHAFLHAWTDESNGRSSVLAGYGYTSFNPKTFVYGDLNFLSDLWECTIQAGAADASDATVDPTPTPSTLPQPGLTRMVVVNPTKCYEVLHATVLSKPDVRKLCGDLCPPSLGRGALVAHVTYQSGRKVGHPVQPAAFFTKGYLTTWLTDVEIHQRFPGLWGEEFRGLPEQLAQFDPVALFFVIYVLGEGSNQETTLASGHYSRYQPGMTYRSTNRETGNVGLSTREAANYCNGVVPETIATEDKLTMQLCGYVPCRDKSVTMCATMGPVDTVHDFEKRMAATLEGRKLKSCRGCFAIKYCSPKCQKADWAEHKATCSKLAAST